MDWGGLLQLIGAAAAMGLGAVGSALAAGHAAGSACEAIARQPWATGQIRKTMLIGQGVSSTPSIFALVVALLVITTKASGTSLIQGFGYLGAGLCIGLATMGGGLGSGFANATACEGVGRCPQRIGGIIRMMIVGQAVTQSASIFALLVSFMLMFTDPGGGVVRATALIASGVCMGAGGIGPGIGAGLAAGEAARGVSRYAGSENVVLRTMLIGQAVAQSTAIYALVVALLLIYYV